MATFEHLREKISRRQQLPDPVVRRLLRTGCSLTHADLAEELGVTRPTVTRWESGARTPRGEDFRRYVELLNVLAERQVTK
jgi:DNA-binding transcriptional regulator YiaG